MKKIIPRYFLLPVMACMAAFTWMPTPHAVPGIKLSGSNAGCERLLAAAFTVTASDVAAPRDSVVCLEIKSSDFNRILSMQYSMNWDAQMLKFREVRAFGLPGLSNNNFGTHSTKKGILTFSWYDPNLRGLTKNGETKLYEVCFQVAGEAGKKTRVVFNGHPTSVEIANAAGVFLDFKTGGGLVEIK